MSSALNEKTISRDEFIESNLGLVHSCANRFRGKGVEYEELYAAGCVGLIKAYDAFNTDRGVKSVSYTHLDVYKRQYERCFGKNSLQDYPRRQKASGGDRA